MTDKTAFDVFFEKFTDHPEDFRSDLLGDGTFEYGGQVTALIEFSNKVNENIFVKLFGQELGVHLMHKFVINSNRNLLQFFAGLSNEYRFFILHQIKTNKELYHPY